MKPWLRTVFCLTAVIATAQVSAQDMGWSTIIPSVAGTDTLGLVLREQMDRSRAQPSPPPVAALSLRFTPSKARRTQNFAAFVEKTRRIDAGNAADLERLFVSGDVIEKLAPLMRPLGLRTDDLADTYAIWWITAWNATQGINPDPSRGMSEAVSAQAARALAATPGIAGAPDAAKQEFAESLLVQMIMIDTAIEQNKNNPAQLKAAGAAVKQGARKMGLDLAAMRLTEAGFVPTR
jgi:hypothetical protein